MILFIVSGLHLESCGFGRWLDPPWAAFAISKERGSARHPRPDENVTLCNNLLLEAVNANCARRSLRVTSNEVCQLDPRVQPRTGRAEQRHSPACRQRASGVRRALLQSAIQKHKDESTIC